MEEENLGLSKPSSRVFCYIVHEIYVGLDLFVEVELLILTFATGI
jgi:hypothetical protein